MKVRKQVLTVIIPLALVVTILSTSARLFALPPEHIIDGFEVNEPVNVHTPVISPTKILDENGNDIPGGGHGTTQFVDENGGVDYQLRLDNDYIIHWLAYLHRDIQGYGWSDEPSPHNDDDPAAQFDKYVQDKWMKFPFEVFYDGVFYELNGNYTDWIQIKRPDDWHQATDNHWRDTPIYIPSYAREMGEVGNEGSIMFKVEAINVDGDMAAHFAEMEPTANVTYNYVLADDGAMYVATYEIPVQLSGYIYNFTITGTNNGQVYAGEGMTGSNEISFVMSKTEKKAGTKNRIGHPALRYVLDGSLCPLPWSTKNTITLTDAKSPQFTKQGAAWKGQTFSFRISTLANLWDVDNGDRLEIEPTFTYYDSAGNKRDMSQIKVYYTNPYGAGEFIEYGSNRDTLSTNWATTYIGSKMNEGAYYTEHMTDTISGGSARKYHFGNWDGFTAQNYGISKEVLLNRRVTSYCLSHITLNPQLRLYAGEWEELRWNIKGSGAEYEGVKRYPDIATGGFSTFEEERFRKSIQTWYGSYYVPADLYIVDLTKHPGFDIQDYMEHANGGLGIRDDDPVFEKNGLLIVNFDIVSYNDGHRHLRYSGGSSGGSMWDTENFPNTPDPDDPNSPPIPGYDDGDVIVIDISKSTKDKYSAGIFDVN